MKKYLENYGLTALSLDEEIALPEPMRSTRSAKMELVNAASHMETLAVMIRDRAKQAPVLDDEKHAEIVRRFLALTREAEKAVTRAYLYNGEDISRHPEE